MMDSFAPAILVNGRTITPKGYEWVLGFALAGCDWALEKASTPEFLEMVQADLKKETIKRLEKLIQEYKQEIIKYEKDIIKYKE